MAADPKPLTRDQLVKFLPDQESIRRFERLFAVAGDLTPTDVATLYRLTQEASTDANTAMSSANEALAMLGPIVQDAAINAGTADAKSTQALDLLGRISASLELITTSPAIKNDNSVVADYIDLPEVGPHITQPRRIQWNHDDGTMDVGLYGGSVLQVGQEMTYYAKNTSGSTISNGSPVMFTGAVGASGKLTFGPAVADGSVPSEYMMGVATQDIADNAFGYVTSFGLVRGFNTSGVPYGEVWSDGDLLYFDPAAPGTWTNVQPSAPNIAVPVAVVVNAATGGSGSIFVRMAISISMNDLQDVYAPTPANKDILEFDTAAGRWKNVAPSSVSIGTATNIAGGAAGSLPYQTAAGTTSMLAIGTAAQVLQVNAGATAPAWVSSTGTGNVVRSSNPTINGFAGDTSAITIGTNQFFKSTTGNIGIGTVTPTGPTASSRVVHVYQNITNGSAFVAQSSVATLSLEASDNCYVVTKQGPLHIGSLVSAPIPFLINGADVGRWDTSGNLLVGSNSMPLGSVRRGLGVTAPTGVYVAAVFKNDGGSSAQTIDVWNAATSGNNVFMNFGTEGSYTSRGSISYNRGSGLVAYNATSDYRSKDVDGEFQTSGHEVDELKVYLGRMKGATISRPMFVAHELQSSAPYAVTGEKDAVDKHGLPIFQQVDHSSLVPMIVAELQSIRRRINHLESTI